MIKKIGFIFLLTSFSTYGRLPSLIRSITHDKPAFTKIIEEDDIANLLVSSFKVMGGDSVKKYGDMENVINSRSNNLTTLTDEIVWPNEIEKMPDVSNEDDFYVIASGFFPPTKNTGGIYLMSKKSGKLTKISQDKRGWWYHRIRFWDVDKDGKLDVLTARAYKGLIWGKGAEFVALLAPNGSNRKVWEEKILFNGPDVFFEIIDVENDGEFEVISSQFLNEKLVYHYKDKLTDNWIEKIIDSSIGAGFDLSIVDLNQDGKLEILVTNHVSTEEAGVFAYEIPPNPESDNWIKHTIHKGFRTTASGIGQASPGNAQAFKAFTYLDEKLSIVVSGDGNEKIHLFSPTETPWVYKHDVIYSGRGIMGKVTTSDVDKDGKSEIYIPAYDENKIHIFEY